jgi:CheY-like chemotaxis protein
VTGDPTRLRQVLLNLVGNAIKFTDQGEITVALRLVGRNAAAAHIEFSVRDTGIGIPADKLDSIFEAFSQADTSTTRKYGGTGLGLSITSHLVELMGGSLDVESRPAAGSTFHFTLPLGLAEEGALTAASGEPAAGEADRAAGSLSVLLVEDNPVNQQLAIRLLEKWGHHIVLAVNGREAVDMVTAGARFDLVLMDMQMPVLGGIAATREIRAYEATAGAPPLRIVAMTANAMQGDREACLAAGMDDYLSKPIQKEELAARLRMAGSVAAASEATIYAGSTDSGAEEFDYAAALGHQDAEIIEILAPAFLQYAQGELDAIAGALAIGDAEEVMRRAHGLKGTLAAFGARPAERLAETMEHRARQGELSDMPSLLHQLAANTATLKQTLATLPGNT